MVIEHFESEFSDGSGLYSGQTLGITVIRKTDISPRHLRIELQVTYIDAEQL